MTGDKKPIFRTLLALCALVALFAWAAPVLSPSFHRPFTPFSPPFHPSFTPPSPSPSPPSVTLALLGSADDPACAPLYPGLQDFCDSQGWAFVSYDCRGRAANQAGQVDDLVRREGAQIAVLSPAGDPEAVAAWTETLALWDCRVVTLNTPEEEVAAAAADYFDGALPRGGEVLVLPTVSEDRMESLCRKALEGKGLTVAHQGYTWDVEKHTLTLLNQVLTDHPGLRGILCFDETGALAAAQTLGERGLEDRVKVLCLKSSPQLLEEIRLGRVSAVTAVTPQAALETLQGVLPQVAQGQPIDQVDHAVAVVTAENVDTLDIGY